MVSLLLEPFHILVYFLVPCKRDLSGPFFLVETLDSVELFPTFLPELWCRFTFQRTFWMLHVLHTIVQVLAVLVPHGVLEEAAEFVFRDDGCPSVHESGPSISNLVEREKGQSAGQNMQISHLKGRSWKICLCRSVGEE